MWVYNSNTIFQFFYNQTYVKLIYIYLSKLASLSNYTLDTEINVNCIDCHYNILPFGFMLAEFDFEIRKKKMK